MSDNNIGEESYRKFLNGDKEGMRELVDTYRYSLIEFINSYIQDYSSAEDLAEEVFVQLLVKKPVFRGDCSFKTWLYSIGRHLTLNYIRRKTIIGHPLSLNNLPELIDLDSDIEIKHLINERNAILYRSLDKLKPEFKQSLTLYYLEGYSTDEIASIMCKNRRQIENIKYRAKKALWAELKKEGLNNED